MICPACRSTVADGAPGCGVCFASLHPDVVAATARTGAEEQARLARLRLTTADSFEPVWRVVRWLGPVFGEAILGANILDDMAAGIRDVVGGRSEAYERQLGKGREYAIAEMGRSAVALGANAVVALRLDYETLKGSMLMVCAQATAVVVDDDQRDAGRSS